MPHFFLKKCDLRSQTTLNVCIRSYEKKSQGDRVTTLSYAPTLYKHYYLMKTYCKLIVFELGFRLNPDGLYWR